MMIERFIVENQLNWLYVGILKLILKINEFGKLEDSWSKQK